MNREPCITCKSRKNKHGVRAPQGYCSKECAHNAPPMAWSPELAYLAGLVASDGCLKIDTRRNTRSMGFTSTELNLVGTATELLKRNSIKASVGTPGTTDAGKLYWQVRWTNYQMYNAFSALGLTPSKSLTMPALSLPTDTEGYSHFWAFFRGIFEGDGSVSQQQDGNFSCVSIISGAPLFVRWLKRELHLRGLYQTSIIRAAHDKDAEILRIQMNLPHLIPKRYPRGKPQTQVRASGLPLGA